MKNLKAIRWVLVYTMALNLVATVAKLGVGYLTGSISLIADGFDSVFDSASNIVGLVGISIAAQPADEEHPYGHRKFETFSAISISVLLFLTCLELTRNAVERLRAPELIAPTVSVWSFAALAVSLGVHLYVSSYEMRAGRKLKSEVLVADAMHTRADIYVSLSVVGGLIAVRLGYPIVDPLLALAIAGVIAKIGIDIIREGSRTLLDRTIVPHGDIEVIARAVPGVVTVHRVRSRGHEDDIHVDLHLLVEPDIPAAQAHAIAHRVQDRLMEDVPGVRDVVIHVEPPRGEPDGGTPQVSETLKQLAAEQGLRLHELRAYELSGQLTVDLHLEVPAGITLQEAHRRSSALVEAAHQALPRLREMTTHLEPALRGTRTEAMDEGQMIEVTHMVEQVAAEWCDHYHKVSVRPMPGGAGGRLFVSLHCQMAPDTPMEEAHYRSQQVESALRSRIPRLDRVIVHMEPLPDTPEG